MQVTINIPDHLAAEAAAHGVAVDTYVEEFLARQTQEATHADSTPSAAEAVDRIRTLRQGVTLGGLKIKDLIHEGHKY